MVFKIGPNWPITVPVWSDQLDRKCIEPRLDCLNQRSNRTNQLVRLKLFKKKKNSIKTTPFWMVYKENTTAKPSRLSPLPTATVARPQRATTYDTQSFHLRPLQTGNCPCKSRIPVS